MTPRYMLDTNICIYLMSARLPRVTARFDQCLLGDLVISAITLAELEFGVACAGEQQIRSRQLLDAFLAGIPVAPFGHGAARDYGVVRALNPCRNRQVLDKLIAAHARALDLVLVTNNEADFLSCPGLRVENWAGSA